MSWDGFRLAVIVLEAIGIALLLLLLATPAPKHAVVSSLLVATILRSVTAVIPPIAYTRLTEEFAHIYTHESLQHFCVGMAILLRYFTVVKSTFSVSFTLPMLYRAREYAVKSENENDSAGFYRRTVIALCAGPFIWALPVILIPLPQIIHNEASLRPAFVEAVCAVTHVSYQIVSLTMLAFPLVCATIMSLLLLWYLRKSVKLPLPSYTLGNISYGLIARLSALLFVIMTSAILYVSVMALWIRRNRRDSGGNEIVFKLSALWEASTSIIIFFVFGAQEKVYRVWGSWIRGIRQAPVKVSCSNPSDIEAGSYLDFPPPARAHLRKMQGDDSSWEQKMDSNHHNSSQDHLMKSRQKRQVTPPGNVRTFPIPILMRSTPSFTVNSSTHIPITPLPPPPRPPRSRTNSSQGEDAPVSFRPMESMPSLTAFNASRMPDRPTTAERSRRRQAEDGGFERDIQVYMQERERRPNTGQSSRTFGK
ncbi:hypothetical protein K474DRAFT_1663482 [Panus rudis PR-1116 ss-1]|nr:hypothetical protein K474DRAFT_1663482 [Panus rudis PR-1116 ss-1]